MSIADAIAFIARIESDTLLRSAIEELKASEGDLEALLALAQRFGHRFTGADLRSGHARDWHMRRAYFGGEALKVGRN